MSKMRWTVVALLVCVMVVARYCAADADPRLKVFAAQKRQQTDELAAKLHLDVPLEARNFFQAAEDGDWITVSNSFERIRCSPGTNGPMPGLRNLLYVPIHETFGAYAEFNDCDGVMLQKFADGILTSLPTGSIYFGGTGSGRFVITALRDVTQSPDIFIVTQNGMQDSLYLEYLRQLYGSRIWVPSEEDAQHAFQQYVEELHTNDEKRVATVVAIRDILTKAIFDHNGAQHEFYVEESFVIPWMYPYLEPHGLIMKLNREPLKTLGPTAVEQDREFWAKLSKELLADPKFLGNEEAQKMYAKLRSAIGGLYVYRHLTNEAEAAFKQAVGLCPASFEANFRLAQLYVEAGRFDDAIAVLEKFQRRLGTTDPHVTAAISRIREMKLKAEKKQPE